MKSHSAQNNNSLDNAVIYWVPLQKFLPPFLDLSVLSVCLKHSCSYSAHFHIFPGKESNFCNVKCRGCSAKIKLNQSVEHLHCWNIVSPSYTSQAVQFLALNFSRSVKVCIRARWPIMPALNSGFCSMKRRMLVHRKVIHQHYDRRYPFIRLGEQRQYGIKFLIYAKLPLIQKLVLAFCRTTY